MLKQLWNINCCNRPSTSAGWRVRWGRLHLCWCLRAGWCGRGPVWPELPCSAVWMPGKKGIREWRWAQLGILIMRATHFTKQCITINSKVNKGMSIRGNTTSYFINYPGKHCTPTTCSALPASAPTYTLDVRANREPIGRAHWPFV